MTNEEILKQQKIIKYIPYFIKAMDAARKDEAVRFAEWISVDDELPKESGRYWCFCESVGELGKSSFQWNCAYDHVTKTFHDFAYSFKTGERVTHWRPLLTPPKTN